jgi:peptide/nickel transport system permease protein
MLEVLRQDYVVTARAKGMHERRVIFRHALKNALIPVITIVGLQFGFALGGAVITETVFARQGVGQLAVTAIQQRDMPLVQGTVIMVGITTVLANLLVDIAYGIVDPRIRYS